MGFKAELRNLQAGEGREGALGSPERALIILPVADKVAQFSTLLECQHLFINVSRSPRSVHFLRVRRFAYRDLATMTVHARVRVFTHRCRAA